MNFPAEPVNEEISPAFVEEVCMALAAGSRVRRKLPGGGLLNIDRLLPFLLVYRRNPRRRDAGTRTLINGEASYLSAPGDAPRRKGLTQLILRIAETASAQLGAFAIVEIWASPERKRSTIDGAGTVGQALPTPRFHIHAPATSRNMPAVNELIFGLEQIHIHRQLARVEISLKGSTHPPGSARLISPRDAAAINCFVMGLEVEPIFRDPDSGEVFPEILRHLRRELGPALRKALFSFSLRRTTLRPEHYFSLGRRQLPRQVWQVDHELAELGARFNFLLQVTPLNSELAWQEFESSGYAGEPVFHYRPQVVDPLLLKRKVNDIATEKITDATMAHLLRQAQDEMDRSATLLSDIGSPRFLQGSLQVFGGVEPSLLSLAEDILGQPVDEENGDTAEGETVDADTFASKARAEMRAYARQHAEFRATVEVRDDLYSGLMVSGEKLLIGRETSLPHSRVKALMAHEIGIHLVTYYNGRTQPMGLLATGLAGYDALQEGLAVLAEYLAGGLSHNRLRMLAARVIAVNSMIAGASFSDTFGRLTLEHGFRKRAAYTITMRVYRGGGLTKDAAYLRGLVEILQYLGSGGDLKLLLMGKLATDHVPIVRELLLREVLLPPKITPLFLAEPAAADKLARLRGGLSVLQLSG